MDQIKGQQRAGLLIWKISAESGCKANKKNLLFISKIEEQVKLDIKD